MTTMARDALAQRIALDIPMGSVVNLGIGAPTAIANHLPEERHVVLHTENGMLGMGPEAHGEEIDPDLINAGKIPVTDLPGASYFNHADSFAMMRGGHLDVCVLGAFEVSVNGDLANWLINAPDAIPAVGGAMDLAIGAQNVWVMMDLLTKEGRPKIVAACEYPLTGLACVSRVYTGHGVFTVGAGTVVLQEAFGDNTVETLTELLGLPIETPGG
jgi:3-oxoadipate CoA-transferase, beta subunit